MTKKELLQFFEENEDFFIEAIEELDSYNGYLGDNRVEDMELFDDYLSGLTPSELAKKIFNGYDYDSTYTEEKSGRTVYEEFNPNSNYFYFSGCGNLVSTNYKDYSGFLDNYFLDSLIENKDYLCLDSDLEEMIENIEE